MKIAPDRKPIIDKVSAAFPQWEVRVFPCMHEAIEVVMWRKPTGKFTNHKFVMEFTSDLVTDNAFDIVEQIRWQIDHVITCERIKRKKRKANK